MEEAVAVVGSLLGNLGRADGAVPYERRDVVQRARSCREALQRGAETAFPVDVLFAPQAVQQGIVFDCQRDAFTDVLAEPRVDGAGVAAAHHEADASASQVLQVGVVFGQPDWVIGCDEGCRGAQVDLLGPRGQVRQEDCRVGGGDKRRVVVLAGCEDVEPGGFCVFGDLHGAHQPFVLGGDRSVHGVAGDITDGEDSEFHSALLSSGGVN